jgi:hypothetical protein
VSGDLPVYGDDPACWSWEVPPFVTREQEIERLLAEQEGKPPALRYNLSDIELMLAGDESLGRWGRFHGGRCAICGVRGRRLVVDHCHQTGQVRGDLCRGCNTQEGVSGELRFVRYRLWHPAAILDYHEPYTGMHWEDGYWLGEARLGGVLDRGPRPAEPWPARTREDALRLIGK